MFLSGYLFYYLHVEQQKYQKFTSFVVKKAKRLLVPYIFVCLLWAIPFFIFFGGHYTQILHKFILGESPEQLWFLLIFSFYSATSLSFIGGLYHFSLIGIYNTKCFY